MPTVDNLKRTLTEENEVPYLMHRDALELKALALKTLREPIDPATPPHERDLVVPAQALISLIEQAHSPQLGLATTRQLREELDCREKDPISRQDDYRTFGDE